MNTWTASNLAAGYARHAGTLRGALRHALVARAILAHLPGHGARVLDIGGGAGHQAIALARAGHQVTILDPDPGMRAEAAAAIARQAPEISGRVTVAEGVGERAAEIVGDGWDAVCCHGVLMYLDDPDAMLKALVAAARPGGLVSVLAKNAAALAMRPGLEGRWADALDQIRSGNPVEQGRLGVTSRGQDRDQITRVLAAAGAPVIEWHGVRVFTDHLRDAPVGQDFDLVCEAEWEASRRDPYRRTARLFHLLVRREKP